MASASLLLLGILYCLHVTEAERSKELFDLPTLEVCGDDGTTYETLGELHLAQLGNQDLKVMHTGPCHNTPSSESLSPSPGEDNTIWSSVEDRPGLEDKPNLDTLEDNPNSSSLEDKPSFVLKKLKKHGKNNFICTLEYMPVCGTDGKTYGNECSLAEHKIKDPTLRVAHKGPCNKKTSEKESVKSIEIPSYCPSIEKLVCGSDGKTYTNYCVLHYIKKKKNPKLHMKYRGPCKGVHEKGMCTMNLNPVCGTDGKTYFNDCLLDRELGLQKKHDGPCEEDTQELESGELSEELGEGSKKACPLNIAPVCGSDGKTYSNKCYLSLNKLYDTTLRLEHVGKCKEEHEEIGDTDERCTLQLQPVCGTDGKTYGNKCLLNVGKSENPKLRLKHYGRCKDKWGRSRNQENMKKKWRRPGRSHTYVDITSDTDNGNLVDIEMRLEN